MWLNKIRISKILLLGLMLLVLLTGPTLLGCANTGKTPQGWSGAVVDGEAVFLGSMDGELVSINTLNRERRWDDVLFEATKSARGFSCAQGSSAVAIYGSPALAGDLVYSTAYNGKVYAINADSGKLRWIYPREGELEPIVGGPVVTAGSLYFGGSDGRVYALDAATGDLEWEFETGGKIWSTPSVVGDTLYIGSFDKKIYALDTTDGSQKWEYETEGTIVATPLVRDGTVYVGSFDRNLYALNADDGSLKWKTMAGNWFWAETVADDSVVYAGSIDGKVYALKAGDGTKMVVYDLGSPISSSPVVVDGSVIVATEEGRVFSLEAGDIQPRELANLEKNIYAPLAAGDDGTVYIHGDDDVLQALDARSGAILWSLSLEG